MQRTFLILLALFTTTLMGAAAPIQQSSDFLTSFSVNSNLRSGGGVEWNILGSYTAGTPIRLDGQAFTGSWVRGIVPDGTVGWVLSANLNITHDQAAGLRGIWVEEPFNLPAPAGGSAPAAPAQAANAQSAQQPPASSAPVAAPAGGIATTVANGVNMRDNPDGNFMRGLKFGEPVAVDGKHPNGRWVRVITAEGARGWVVVDFIVLTGDQFTNLPVVEGGASSAAAAAPAQAAADTSAALPPPAVNTAPIRGFNYGGHVAHLGANTVQRMQQSRMTWVKRQWRYLRGQSPDALAGYINEAHAYGFNILIGIVGLPNELNQPGYQDDYANFVAGAAALGANGIEVWNEPNIDREWPAGSISPQGYTSLLSRAYNAIKAANPNTMVVSGAPAPTGFFGGCHGGGCDDAAFIRGMAAAGAANYMDCLGIHYNEGILSPDQTSGDPRGNSGHYTRYFWGMLNTYSGAIGGRRPLCFTELGYLTPEGFPPLPGAFGWAENVTLAQQAAWLDRAVALAAGSGRVRLLIVWNVDFTEYGGDPMAGYAMIRPDGSCPACDALAR